MDAGYVTYSRPRELTTPRVNPNVNSALGVMMLHQCRFIRWNKCTALMGDVDHWGRLCTPGDGEGQRSMACCSPWGSQKVGHNLVTIQQQDACVESRGHPGNLHTFHSILL